MLPKIIPNLPASEYHSMTEYISNSTLGRLDKCPAAALVPSEDTDYFVEGRAVHSLILEGDDAFSREFAVAPKVDKRTKEGKAQYAEFTAAANGKSVIDQDLFDKIQQIQAAVNSHPFASKLLRSGLSEQSIFWQDTPTGVLCKCRPDRIPSGDKGVLVDLKTTSDAGERAFSRSCVSYGYARQAAFYLDGVYAATGKQFDAFAFVVVEKTAPFRVETYLLDSEFIDWGRLEYQRLLTIYDNCRRSNNFPNYQHAGLTTIYKPTYL